MHSSLPQIEQIFAHMRDEAGWDVAGPLLWGFFFTAADPAKLSAAAERLTATGYRKVDLYAMEPDDESEPSRYFLHVERVERLTPATLHERNRRLNAFAAELGLESYDGWDVGAAPGASVRR
ncbi:MAG TPA: ribonuclease E inhibitor RraB [Gemmatimonadaceae bacterium]|nr:ribonuclease E inhibitor RraB [Gemmatimonadaceae bacterium]